ncbi:MAG: hypothetical protein V3R82_05880 [Candidatus Hydrothermarchaeales archaeon]
MEGSKLLLILVLIITISSGCITQSEEQLRQLSPGPILRALKGAGGSYYVENFGGVDATSCVLSFVSFNNETQEYSTFQFFLYPTVPAGERATSEAKPDFARIPHSKEFCRKIICKNFEGKRICETTPQYN